MLTRLKIKYRVVEVSNHKHKTEVITLGNGDAKSLREAMDFFKLSNNDISVMVGVDRTHISMVVNGKRFLTIEKAIKLAAYFKKHHKLDINWKDLISEKNRIVVESVEG